MKLFSRVIVTQDLGAIVFIRLMVGAVFLSEGIQKFLFPEVRGAGRFETIGLPNPEFLGTFVGFFEILCGVLVLLGLITRVSVLPLIVIMIVAVISTKIPQLATKGVWETLHASRTDFSMIMGCFFLLFMGGGRWSLDQYLTRKSAPEHSLE
jgi:putative oxidoreductase